MFPGSHVSMRTRDHQITRNKRQSKTRTQREANRIKQIEIWAIRYVKDKQKTLAIDPRTDLWKWSSPRKIWQNDRRSKEDTVIAWDKMNSFNLIWF